MRTCLLAASLLIASTASGLTQDASAGQTVFKRMCFACHDAGPGAKVKLGPPLNGLDGRTAGTMPGFNYSEANKTSGITWNEATFAEYVKSPQQRMPGTRMAFAGLKDEKDIGNLWTFLKQFDDSGNPK